MLTLRVTCTSAGRSSRLPIGVTLLEHVADVSGGSVALSRPIASWKFGSNGLPSASNGLITRLFECGKEAPLNHLHAFDDRSDRGRRILLAESALIEVVHRRQKLAHRSPDRGGGVFLLFAGPALVVFELGSETEQPIVQIALSSESLSTCAFRSASGEAAEGGCPDWACPDDSGRLTTALLRWPCSCLSLTTFWSAFDGNCRVIGPQAGMG